METSVPMCSPPKPFYTVSSSPDLNPETLPPRRRAQKVVVVMGATGTGKSRLAVELAARFVGEVINSDKMQFHQGLPILTNKITDEEKRGIPHHMLDITDPDADFTAADFHDFATLAVEGVAERGRVPIVAGGSNSYVEALVKSDKGCEHGPRFEFFFVWLYVSEPVLHSAVSGRVDQMVKLGMEREARGMFDPDADYSRGIRRAIGVPELDRYFRFGETLGEEERAKLLRDAISETKINTCKLASRQTEKINQLQKESGWNVHRVDATPVFLKKDAAEALATWKELVVAPSVAVVRQFLNNDLKV